MLSNLQVLVLEDHPVHRMLAVEQLRLLGCAQIFSAEDGNAGLAILEAHGAVDIVICDLNMEGMDGLEFLRHVGHMNLANSVVLYSLIDIDLRRSTQNMLALHGLTVLGDLGKPMKTEELGGLLRLYFRRTDRALRQFVTADTPSREEILLALQQKCFKAHYQPKFDLKTARPQGAEVLVRWERADGKISSPAYFLPSIEKYNLLTELFEQLFEQGCAFQANLLRGGYRLPLSYNLHVEQLPSLDLTRNIKETLRRHAIPASTVTFEILETGLIEAPALSLENLIRLRMMGCDLAIDDFGTGHSSLQRLCDLPFNQIKLDIHFVRELDLPRCRAVISSTLAMAKVLNMSLVVEGVETDLQRRKLLELGCAIAQGYWYSKPMGESEMAAWIVRAETAVYGRSLE